MRFVDPAALAALQPSGLDDESLMAAQRALAEDRHAIEAAEAVLAAELVRRSNRDLGYGGLAARQGVRSGAELVQRLTGDSLADARRLARVGEVVARSATEEPWLAPALALPVGSIDAIRAGLGAPTSGVSPEQLTEAAHALVDSAESLHVDALGRLARAMRAELDTSSTSMLEEERRQQRYLRLTPLPTGMTRLSGLLDPESAAIVVGAVDAITAPRRGGPRFVEATPPEDEAQIPDDRTVDQLMADALVDIVSVALKAPSGNLFGKRQPGVRLLVTLDDLNRGDGAAYIEGQTEPVSVQTARRYVCTAGVLPIRFDEEGRGLDLGRSERFHDPRQRRVISARDGGCLIPGCPSPPAWCEVHHIVPWSEGGGTSVDDGVLLCRFHHMMIHNLGGRVVREGAAYVLIPPRSMDPRQEPVPLPPKSAALRRLLVGAGRSA
jgi:hypothetical protein